jgi:hypothetical protein
VTTLEKQALALLIHGNSKVGKSTLASTAPLPMAVADVEGSWKFIRQQGYMSGKPLRRITWNPVEEAPPVHDGTWDLAMINVPDWNTIKAIHTALANYEHPFKSFCLDSITETQRRLKKNLVGTAQMQIQDWGSLLNQMDDLIRGIRDLTNHPHNTLEVVTFISEGRVKDGKFRPYMQGQIETSLPYWVDVCGYMYTQMKEDEQGQPTIKSKQLLVSDHLPQFIAGERVQGALGEIVDEPNITRMIEMIYG